MLYDILVRKIHLRILTFVRMLLLHRQTVRKLVGLVLPLIISKKVIPSKIGALVIRHCDPHISILHN